jgi:hypothetical protein
MNKINLLLQYIEIFNVNFNKNYKIDKSKINNNITTILISMLAVIDNIEYKHSMIFILDKKNNYYEITELMNSIIEINKVDNKEETKELNNFKSIRYKLKI